MPTPSHGPAKQTRRAFEEAAKQRTNEQKRPATQPAPAIAMQQPTRQFRPASDRQAQANASKLVQTLSCNPTIHIMVGERRSFNPKAPPTRVKALIFKVHTGFNQCILALVRFGINRGWAKVITRGHITIAAFHLACFHNSRCTKARNAKALHFTAKNLRQADAKPAVPALMFPAHVAVKFRIGHLKRHMRASMQTVAQVASAPECPLAACNDLNKAASMKNGNFMRYNGPVREYQRSLSVAGTRLQIRHKHHLEFVDIIMKPQVCKSAVDVGRRSRSRNGCKANFPHLRFIIWLEPANKTCYWRWKYSRASVCFRSCSAGFSRSCRLYARSICSRAKPVETLPEQHSLAAVQCIFYGIHACIADMQQAAATSPASGIITRVVQAPGTCRAGRTRCNIHAMRYSAIRFRRRRSPARRRCTAC